MGEHSNKPGLPTGIAADSMIVTVAPVLFVFFWSTGFVAARLILPHGEPYTMLTLRYIPVMLFFAGIALWLRRPMLTRQELPYAVAGAFFMQLGYFGGVFIAIYHGAEAGTVALIVGLQPVLSGVGAALFLGEKVSIRVWAGLGLGTIAAGLVVWEKLSTGLGTILGTCLALTALLSITAGTLVQKRSGGTADLWVLNAAQHGMGIVFCLIAALILEEGRVELTTELVIGYGWMVWMSCVTLPLLYLMLRFDAASRVGALFCLIPPLTATFAAILFGERLGVLGFMGFGLAAIAVWMVRR